MAIRRLSALVPVKSRLRKAEQLAKAGQGLRAFALAAPLARRGAADAQLYIARAYLEGRGVPPCPAEGLKWCERAARGGLREAQTLAASLRLTACGNLATDTGLQTVKKSADFERGIFWAQMAAEAGCPDAKALLAYLHTSGPASMRDKNLSASLYRDSAEGGSPQGALGHGLLLLSTAQDDAARRTAVTWIRKAADANLPFAFHLLGLAEEHGFGSLPDLPAAITLYRKAAQNGVVPAQARLGAALLKGEGVPQNTIEGETWLRRAALAGDAAAAYTVGSLYGVAGALPPNNLEASTWYSIAANLGRADAARALAKLYSAGGHGLARDRNQAAQWLCRSARADDATIWAELAALVLTGAGGEAVRARTQQWYEAVAQGGDPVAAYTLAMLLLKGPEKAQALGQAARWMARAAESVVDAQFIYGRMLCEGTGVAQDLAAGRAVLGRAAEAGHLEAKVLLAEMLLNGRGGSKDLEAAMVLFQAAAGAGHAGALYAIAILHCGTNGVPPDRQRARQMFSLAADRGHGFAQLALGRFFLHGVAGERDLSQARYWLKKAGTQGVKEALLDLESLSQAA